MNIIVLAGGLSPERDVSLSSGSLISSALIENGHNTALIDLYFGTDLPVIYSRAGDKKPAYKVADKEPDLAEIIRQNGGRKEQIGKNIIEACAEADVVFLALHGGIGENGQLQAVFDSYNIKYTGTGYIGSLLAMDKDLSKRLFRLDGIPTADWTLFEFGETDIAEVERSIGYPCVVKPRSCGSSVGVSVVYDRAELKDALGFASEYENSVMIEKKVSGREFSVGILKGKALPVIEIIPKSGFYDYKNKYQSGMTTEITPAALTTAQTSAIQAAAEKVHRVLRLGGYSRTDFILDSASGEFVCLEANTLPGMTPTSLLPQEARAAGISYGELCEMICKETRTR
jgi:D-alanine-D-alanine ligase